MGVPAEKHSTNGETQSSMSIDNSKRTVAYIKIKKERKKLPNLQHEDPTEAINKVWLGL